MEFFHLSKIYSDGDNSSAIYNSDEWTMNMHAFEKHLMLYKRLFVHMKKQSTSV